MNEKLALANATAIASVFGKVEKKKEPQNSEVVVLGAEEVKAVENLVKILIAENRKPTDQELEALPRTTNSLDVAMFGRMRAATPHLNTDASIYVSHPLTTNKASIDADFWTAVDDLKELDTMADGGAGGMGETEFGSGSFYTYVQVNLGGLSKNLGEDAQLAKKAVVALIRAIATTSPNGHKATFGNEVRAGNLFCKAFEKPVATTSEAINILREVVAKEKSAYALDHVAFELSTVDGEGSLNSVIEAVSKALESK
jgi:CRISPR system Cascade subunit CasC